MTSAMSIKDAPEYKDLQTANLSLQGDVKYLRGQLAEAKYRDICKEIDDLVSTGKTTAEEALGWKQKLANDGVKMSLSSDTLAQDGRDVMVEINHAKKLPVGTFNGDVVRERMRLSVQVPEPWQSFNDADSGKKEDPNAVAKELFETTGRGKQWRD